MDVPVIVVDIALVLVVVGALAAIVRAAIGPSRADRVVAAELGFIAAVSAMLLIAMRLEEPVLFDFALIAVLIGFLTTIGLARLVTRKRSDLSGESS
ncbi:MAG TPA: monovalent cation/H+ antiporter complex subunit F [Candidatus Nanopelagicales bacterium]|nr:monovalent cation/H+ antiporter complex subunit F [Candidatus Nanopelagicales bacterium]